MNWSSTGLHIAIPTDGPRKGRSKGVGRGVAGLAKAVAGFAEWRTGVRRVDENCLSIKEVPIRLADGTRSLPAVLVCPPAEVLVGQGDARQYIPARVEVTGALDGWDFSVQRVGEASREPERPDNVIITLHRAKGPLIFDLGICLVLFALPALTLAVAIQIALGRRKFVPPFVT